MNKVKEYIMMTIMALAILIMTGVARADEPKSISVSDFLSAIASLPGKVVNHVQSEAEKTKDFQQKSWSDAKSKWPFNKISSN